MKIRTLSIVLIMTLASSYLVACHLATREDLAQLRRDIRDDVQEVRKEVKAEAQKQERQAQRQTELVIAVKDKVS